MSQLQSANLDLPFIAPAQAQKHVTHNMALTSLDSLVQLSVKSRELNAPPPSPGDGERYLVAASPTGEWAGHENHIAAFQDGAWTFFVPREGWLAWVESDGKQFVHTQAAWVEANPDSRLQLGINTNADATNRLAVKSDSVLHSHDDVTPGSGSARHVINKSGVTDTASVVFQTGWSGRAEFGLAGDEDWTVKTSPDGTNWNLALTADNATGALEIGTELKLPDGVKIANDGTSTTSGLELEGGGDLGKVALVIKSVTGLSGALFEQRATDPGVDVVDFGLKTLTEQINLRVESRGVWTLTGDTPEFQIGNKVDGMPLDYLFGVSPSMTAVNAPMRLKSFTVATLPATTSSGAGALIYVSDEAGGAVVAFSDGTDWRRVTDRAIVT